MIPDRYPVREIGKGGYSERTLANVLGSDGTVVIHAGELEGGTRQTVQFCIENSRPHQLIDSASIGIERAAEIVAEFVAQHRVVTLNVAGPRASKQPQIYGYVFAVFAQLLGHTLRNR